MAEESLRLDKFLWFARIVKTRSLAQRIAGEGRLRLQGRVVDRAHVPVRVGDVLSFAVHGRVRVIRIEALPARRGPPAVARLLYSEMGEGRPATDHRAPAVPPITTIAETKDGS
ncbi:RNA-binding S4 domain-containing protein [Sphingosinicella rhizophila]|uniref:RNA-binding S4 domain-containing protein n=1 Tax=Sphingosinicella rhizophila TaxID=3050082 RepID=A0ABU3Q8D7_9SPHN|nr:RNA-binding S4 domain-containing protein [Sphingosinicella sp. GR2756]MDT9599673.1 RNA-binding S4 domain-containing protein [Sphingosinicella sp. GR2756]